MLENHKNVTALLKGMEQGDRNALDDLVRMLYKDLKKVALRGGAKAQRTLSPTVLVNDALIRLFAKKYRYRDRFHFLGYVIKIMRNLVIDYFRSSATSKRGNDYEFVSLQDHDQHQKNSQLSEMMDSIALLSKINEQQARFVVLKHFHGYTLQEISDQESVPVSTIHRELKAAEAWLYLKLKK